MDKQYTMKEALVAIIGVIFSVITLIWLMEAEPYNSPQHNDTFNHKQVDFDSLVVAKDYMFKNAIETLSNRIKEQDKRIEQVEKSGKTKHKIGDNTYEPNSKW